MSPRSMHCAAPTRTASSSAGSAATGASTTSCATATFRTCSIGLKQPLRLGRAWPGHPRDIGTAFPLLEDPGPSPGMNDFREAIRAVRILFSERFLARRHAQGAVEADY